MSKNSNGKYIFYSVVVLTAAGLFIWASSRFPIDDVATGVIFIASMGFSFWMLLKIFEWL